MCYLPDEASHTAALAKMELGDVWGIGRRLAPRLAALGITSPLKLREADPTRIRERFNVVLQRTVMELQGTPCLDLEQDSPDSKTICCSRSFGRAVEGFDELAEALTAYTSYAAQKMRAQALATAAVVAMLTTNRHKPEDAQYAPRRGRAPLADATGGTSEARFTPIGENVRDLAADRQKSEFNCLVIGLYLYEIDLTLSDGTL